MSVVLLLLAIVVGYVVLCDLVVPTALLVLFFPRFLAHARQRRAERKWRDEHTPTQSCGACGAKTHELSCFREPMIARCPACHRRAFPWIVRWWASSCTRATFTWARIRFGKAFLKPKTPCAYKPGDFVWFVATGEILEVGSVRPDYEYTGPMWWVVPKKYPHLEMMEEVLLGSSPPGLTEAECAANARKIVEEARSVHAKEI